MDCDWEELSSVICNNKGADADQPVHPHSLISDFVIFFVEVISRLATSETSIFLLAKETGLRLALSEGNPEDRFSRVVASYIYVACSTALGQIIQVQQIIILKKK